MKYLPQINCSIFLNADMIAAGLAPFGTGEKLLKAGKLFLHEIEQAQKRREDFAFETTLSGKSHLSRVRRMLAEGWRVNLIYLWLPGVEASLSRSGNASCKADTIFPKMTFADVTVNP